MDVCLHLIYSDFPKNDYLSYNNFLNISILTPGEDVTLNVDYNSYKANIGGDEKTK